MKPDQEIARAAKLEPIENIAKRYGINRDEIDLYGDVKAKVKLSILDRLKDRPNGKYIDITAISPTPLGEGKTTNTVGVTMGLTHIGKKAACCIRQASLGPVFGIKGGAAGGGYSQVVPMERLNLHLTGDIHAVTAAHNLLAAMLDAHLFHGNARGLDLHAIDWKRALDVNDRALRSIVVGLGGRLDGVPRQSGFDITAASEVMAVLALATSLADLRARLGRIVVGYTASGEPVTAEDLDAAGAMAVLLRDALRPNLMQTLEQTPVLVHAGPFGNIAHGCSSVVADLIGLRAADVVVTEAGFGSDMGAERFFNIKCRTAGLAPDAAVVVATVRALKAHSGGHRVVAGKPLPEAMLAERPDEVHAGIANLVAHIENVQRHGVTPVVAINAFPTDHPSEHAVIRETAEQLGVRVAVTTNVAEGGKGGAELAEVMLEAANEPSSFRFLYPDEATLREKIAIVATQVYGADGVDEEPAATRALDRLEGLGYGHLPVCIAKTHLSLSHDPTLLGRPRGFRLPIREVRASIGAGFVYPICGTMSTMPGLGAHPAAEHIDIDADGQIVGLS